MSEVPDNAYIDERTTGKFRVRLPRKMTMLPSRSIGEWDTIEEARDERDRAIADYEAMQAGAELELPEIEGWTNEDSEAATPGEAWWNAFQRQAKVEKAVQQRARQTITIPRGDRPFAMAYLSDPHFGGPGTDYVALKADAELIRDTPRMYAGFHGDGINNWIAGRLQALQRNEIMTHEDSIVLFADWLSMIGPSLLWVVCGNHDNWTRKLSGLDLPRSLLSGTRVLYHYHQVCFALVYGEQRLRYKVQHKWRGHSVFNVTHAIEVGWQRGGDDFDVGIGGHTHIMSVCRPFGRHGLLRQAVVTGTYKVEDEYGKELGLAKPMGRGCGAHVFWNGEMIWCRTLTLAAALLGKLS